MHNLSKEASYHIFHTYYACYFYTRLPYMMQELIMKDHKIHTFNYSTHCKTPYKHDNMIFDINEHCLIFTSVIKWKVFFSD
ncbi:hypothetical protein VCRA2110O179_100170 [Vibrio crassostreae]|nr:hypothetical protein VCRA2110O180_90170 [Vibrio crassostreae]CAK2396336.1 hypothetical protein VCRA2110O179_100170 [Vibrio crassostreae]CAK3174283.1 hypothetical protein VCRA2120O253_90170 [Vibrio crassostreae]CAK3178689.1 hypothetical protein VCRA2123O282_100171 [Vibrio crassostreae]CAK4027755.1 hypothetical protein VCRA2123O285_90169 [Vibrio crassostreae]